ncbi:MAG: chitobiase/beta-hexosaminidase C-terminal domain-containing protein [Butyricicoccus sp.]|nr:chitobiase/beta-hexosaminidase C-terminal domain-containing protein [Butyricicoccus sp.]
MAINLSSKYASQIAELFSHESFVQPHTNGDLDFTGAKTVRVYKLEPNDEVDYKRSGDNRFGTGGDVQDTVFEYTMTQDKAWRGIVDKGDESDQSITKKAGKFVKIQTQQKTTPNADKYALRRFATLGNSVTISAAPTKTTVVGMFSDIMAAFDNALVPDSGRVVYVPVGTFKLVAMSDEFIKIEALGEKSVAKGEVGMIFGMKVIKVPDRLMPENCYALATYTAAVAMPYKIQDCKVHQDAPGISGALIEARNYYDAFVLGEKADGVCACVLESKKLAAPTITDTTKTAVTLECANASEIRYTLDGSDPRFSMTAKVYGAAFDATGKTVRAVGLDDTNAYFTSDMAEKAVAAE